MLDWLPLLEMPVLSGLKLTWLLSCVAYLAGYVISVDGYVTVDLCGHVFLSDEWYRIGNCLLCSASQVAVCVRSTASA